MFISLNRHHRTSSLTLLPDTDQFRQTGQPYRPVYYYNRDDNSRSRWQILLGLHVPNATTPAVAGIIDIV
mgnify:CR=1|jgi:hypothetical protein